MVTATADFEKGTGGTAITTSDPGSATAWDAVPFVTTAPSYNATHIAHGVMACFITGGVQNQLEWSTGIGQPVTDHYGRAYMWISTVSGKFVDVLRVLNGASAGAIIDIDTNTNKINLRDQSGSVIATTTNAASTATYVRIEWHVVNNTSTGSVEVKLYNSPDSITATETLAITNRNTLAQATKVDFGAVVQRNITWWLDCMVAGASSYPGPFPVSSTAPTVSGSTPQGSTLTCDGGTWNSGGTFTLTYQWTRDGSNIGGATSSTYATQAADVGHVVGCTVTATGVVATNETASQASSNTITVTAAVATGGFLAFMA